MAGNSGKEIRVAGTGRVLVGKAGATPSAAPVDTTVPWPTGWVELGYTTTDGIKFNKKDKIDPVDTWQSVSPARFIYSDRDLTVKFQLLQLNKDTLPFFMGGGAAAVAATPAEAGTYRYDLATNPQSDERQLGFEFTDYNGTTAVAYRFIVPRGQVTETEELSLTRSGAIKLGVTFTAVGQDDPTKPLAYWLMKDGSYA
ncbi:phage tail tube protein [Streptomyces beijiangensis]|uniref:Phage tail protein n=1 Tax=Streptomyces beijiangensis TaxID=163361 RepID=A0A939JJ79_9ACTN|nr:phage tail protein [Streptomyces beijiangensis]MBO0513364.1 phage tail protein [Streptomyces beijiangensis]